MLKNPPQAQKPSSRPERLLKKGTVKGERGENRAQRRNKENSAPKVERGKNLPCSEKNPRGFGKKCRKKKEKVVGDMWGGEKRLAPTEHSV